MTDTHHEISCSDFSRDANEQLFGTVKRTTMWLVLEYNGRWQPEAFEESDLPAEVKTHLSAFTDSDPQTRILLIRQNPRLLPGGIAFFVALSRETDSALYIFHLDRYEDLLALDIHAIRAGDKIYDSHRTVEPLFLVCTHGRRDKCCAQHGLPVYEQMAALGGTAVWQTSHVGGHRFAANVVCLPEGIVYGRVNTENAAPLIRAYQIGQLIPALLRGRSIYAKREQVAESLLRLETGVTARDAFRLAEIGIDGAIRFVAVADGATHAIHLAEDKALGVYSSCGDMERASYIQYRLLRHKAAR